MSKHDKYRDLCVEQRRLKADRERLRAELNALDKRAEVLWGEINVLGVEILTEISDRLPVLTSWEAR